MAWLAAAASLLLASCEGDGPVSVPSAVAYRLPVRELAGEALPADATWGRPTARQSLVDEAGEHEFQVEGACTFGLGVSEPPTGELFTTAFAPRLVAELERRGARNVATASAPAETLEGTALDFDYAVGRSLSGEIHVEVRRRGETQFELFYVIRESTLS